MKLATAKIALAAVALVSLPAIGAYGAPNSSNASNPSPNGATAATSEQVLAAQVRSALLKSVEEIAIGGDRPERRIVR